MRYLILFIFLFHTAFADNLDARLQNLLKNTKIRRVTILKYDPFFIKKELKKGEKVDFISTPTMGKQKFHLISILGKKAFVDHRWVGKDDIIGGYRVKKILKDSVILIKKRKTRVLKFIKSKNIINIREK